jgi:ribosome biogenesis GTPase A
MSIQWFPGHMSSARKKAAETMESVDVVVEMLDARIPRASCNPLITELRLQRQRPCVKVLNKADLADPAVTETWLDFFNSQARIRSIALCSKSAGDARKIPRLCESLAPHRNSTHKPLRTMIMGIPNVGKSTLMNTLLRRRISKVGDEPAVTRSQLSLRLNDRMVLIDSPGLMWPKIESHEDGLKLASVHAIGRNATIDEEVAEYLATLVLSRYPGLLSSRYGFAEQGMDGIVAIESIARCRGCFLKGRVLVPDIAKAAMILLTDFRNGKLGRISLEAPTPAGQGL